MDLRRGSFPKLVSCLNCYSRISDVLGRRNHSPLSPINFISSLCEISFGGRTDIAEDEANKALSEVGICIEKYLGKLEKELASNRCIENRGEAGCVRSIMGTRRSDWQSGVDEVFNIHLVPSKVRSADMSVVRAFTQYQIEISWQLLVRISECAMTMSSLRSEFGFGFPGASIFRLIAAATWCEQHLNTTMVYGRRIGVPQLCAPVMKDCGWENPKVALEAIANQWSDTDLSIAISYNRLQTDKGKVHVSQIRLFESQQITFSRFRSDLDCGPLSNRLQI